jgi:general secretion pathway protein D
MRNSKVNEALGRRLEMDFVDRPLSDVALYLTDVTGVTFHLQRKKLEEASVSETTPVTSHFKDIRLKTWLDLALEELELTYVVRDDIVVITTPEHAEATMEVRVYDCRDLLAMPAPVGADKWLPATRRAAGVSGGFFSMPDEPAAAASAKTQGAAGAPAPGRGGGGFGGGPMASGADPYSGNDGPGRPLSEHDLRVESLITLITGNIDPDSWDDVGGPGSIHEYNGLIVVTQTGQTHDKIERVLDMLRAAAGLDGPGVVVRD